MKIIGKLIAVIGWQIVRISHWFDKTNGAPKLPGVYHTFEATKKREAELTASLGPDGMGMPDGLPPTRE